MLTTIDLQGKWCYELDYEDKGIEENWFSRKLKNEEFIIPGTTASNKVGKRVSIPRELTKESVKCLREEYKYLGAAWYQTEFILSKEFADKRVEFLIERVMFESTLWIDGVKVGKRDSLSTSHVYEITEFTTVGKNHIITLRIDNRDIHNIGPYPSAYTDETQTIWNGMVGKIGITEREKVIIEDVIIGLDASLRKMFVTFEIDGIEQPTSMNIDISLSDEVGVVTSYSTVYERMNLGEKVMVEVPLSDEVQYWDEFSPKLYDVIIKVSSTQNEKRISGSWCKKTGLKEITANKETLLINGVQRFLRGNIDCCIYPITAYPPMNIEEWRKVCITTKEYGLNHIRFHSWCPPEAAFEAADEIGLYLQVEGPVWMDTWAGYTVGCHREHYSYLPEEAKRIILSYSYHPSFCIFSNGNELNGDFNLLEEIIREMKQCNPYILYTLTTNWDRKINEKDDLFIAQSVDDIGVRGQYYLDKLVESTQLCYEYAVKLRNVPIISHEVGQYVVYPNIEEISNYTGVLKAVNLESIKIDLDKKGLSSYVAEYVMASGKLAALLYKAEIEAALRTKNFGGIQLLELQDFSGQSTATIGLLDCFYQSKGILTSSEFREFCNSTVLLANMPKIRYLTSEDFEFELQISHYNNYELQDIQVEIKMEVQGGNEKKELWTSMVTIDKISIGLNKGLVNFKNNVFSSLKGRNAITLTASIKSMNISNRWDIWVYEDVRESNFPNCFDTMNQDAIVCLEAGENIIIFANANKIRETGVGKFFPVFWSPVHFVSQDPCGMIINNEHPFFQKYYQTDKYADFEWKNILENSFTIKIDNLTEFTPMTMPVPNFFNNHKFTNLFEAKVLKGKVLVCSLDLEKNYNCFPEIRSLKKALSDYYLSDDFCPTQTIDFQEFKKLFAEEHKSLEHGINVALNKPAFADSVRAGGYEAGKGNDGKLTTGWIAADEEAGHSWVVDLQEIYDIKGTKVIFNEEAIIHYVIHVSLDEKKWELVINQTGHTRREKERKDFFETRGRYVRISYNGLPSGVCAGHQEFAVYI